MHGLIPSLYVRPDAAAAPVTTGADGLGSEAARRLRERFGLNSLDGTGPSAARRAIGKLWAPAPWMLEAAMVLEVVLGRYVESGSIGERQTMVPWNEGSTLTVVWLRTLVLMQTKVTLVLIGASSSLHVRKWVAGRWLITPGGVQRYAIPADCMDFRHG